MRKNITMPSDNGNFLEILSDKTKYGGDQNDFHDEKYKKSGCGCIAAANVISYIKSADPNFFKKNIPVDIYNKKIDLTDYMVFVEDISKIMPPDVIGTRLILSFEKYTGNFLKYYPLIFLSKKSLIKKIEKLLLRDIPVILSVYDNSREDKGIKIYSEGNFFATANKHYITITELECDDENTYIILSSWGRKYRMSLDELYKINRKSLINGICTGIFEVKRKIKL